MPLIHHDTTGTQTDCPRPLSRKKLRSLMPLNRNNVTAKALKDSRNPLYIFGRRTGFKIFPRWKQKRLERQNKRKLFEPRTLPDGTRYQMLPNAADLLEIKPTLFERLGSLFGNLRKKAEREKARGK